MRFDKILSNERVIPVSNEFLRRSDNGEKMHLEKVEKVLRDLHGHIGTTHVEPPKNPVKNY